MKNKYIKVKELRTYIRDYTDVYNQNGDILLCNILPSDENSEWSKANGTYAYELDKYNNCDVLNIEVFDKRIAIDIEVKES